MIVAQARNWQLKSSAHSRRGSTVFSRSLESYSGCFPDPWHRNSGEKLFIEHCQGFSGQSPEIRRLLCPRPPTSVKFSDSVPVTSWRAAYFLEGSSHCSAPRAFAQVPVHRFGAADMRPNSCDGCRPFEVAHCQRDQMLPGQCKFHLACSGWQTLISDGLASL